MSYKCPHPLSVRAALGGDSNTQEMVEKLMVRLDNFNALSDDMSLLPRMAPTKRKGPFTWCVVASKPFCLPSSYATGLFLKESLFWKKSLYCGIK